ncbi:MAG TPA: phosphoglycerate mutase family protein [Acidimicrobiales bacterium]
MPVYLVRHAKAGDRLRWNGDDRDRPLSNKGRAQVDGLVKLLADHMLAAVKEEPQPRILSSPYVRCTQTVEPLAAELGLTVEVVEALAEHQPFEPVLELLATLPDHSLLCSHGDVIPATIDALVRRGMVVRGEPDWRKASTWVLHRDGDRIKRAKVIPPPS